MGVRSGSNIKIVRQRGGAAAPPVSLVASIPDKKQKPKENISEELKKLLVGQKSGGTAMINLIHERFYPTDKDSLAAKLAAKLNLVRIANSGLSDRTSGQLDSKYSINEKQFDKINNKINDILDDCEALSCLNYVGNDYARTIHGYLGDYDISLRSEDDLLEVKITSIKRGKLLGEVSCYPRNSIWYRVNDYNLTAQDLNLLQLLGWSMVEKPELLRAIFSLTS